LLPLRGAVTPRLGIQASMPQIAREEFERLPLRVHAFLAGVPLHDVWAVDLPRIRGGITLAEFLRRAGDLLQRPPPARSECCYPCAFSLAACLAGTGPRRAPSPKALRSALLTRTARVHSRQPERPTDSFASSTALRTSSALVETAAGYRFYFAVYVRAVSRSSTRGCCAASPHSGTRRSDQTNVRSYNRGGRCPRGASLTDGGSNFAIKCYVSARNGYPPWDSPKSSVCTTAVSDGPHRRHPTSTKTSSPTTFTG
jgi:hypothetical protein